MQQIALDGRVTTVLLRIALADRLRARRRTCPSGGTWRTWGKSSRGRKVMPVRPLVEDDIPQVADLYWNILCERKGAPPSTVRSFLQELYFKNPWMDSSLPSLVYEEKGRIAGFLGVIPRQMYFQGNAVRIAYGGNFVVHPAFRTTLAGLHLLKTYMEGPQDVSQTDSANDTSRALLERLGFRTILPYSVHWVRLLRPTRCASFAITRVTRNALTASLDFVAKPLCMAADYFAATLATSPFYQGESGLQATELDIPTLLSCLAEFRKGYSLWPDYSPESLAWLLTFMEKMKGHGDNLCKLLLRDHNGTLVGWYIYYRTRGGFGEVAQLGGVRKRIGEVLNHLFHEGWRYGLIGVHGTVERGLMAEFSEQNCFFTCRGGWTLAHSRKPQLIELLESGGAFLSRLDGEWCLALAY
jgi:hypothetical protein